MTDFLFALSASAASSSTEGGYNQSELKDNNKKLDLVILKAWISDPYLLAKSK